MPDCVRIAGSMAAVATLISACSSAPSDNEVSSAAARSTTVAPSTTDRTPAPTAQGPATEELGNQEVHLIASTLFCSSVGPRTLQDQLPDSSDSNVLSDETILTLLRFESACSTAAEGWKERGADEYHRPLIDLAEAARALADCGAEGLARCRVQVIEFEEALRVALAVLEPSASASQPPVTITSRPAPAQASIARDELEWLGLLMAQDLADSLAGGNWRRARTISPTIPYTDEELAAGYEDLVQATVMIGGSERIDDSRLALYLLQVAHRTVADDPITTLYCVRWDLLLEDGSMEQISGEELSSHGGHTDPAAHEPYASQCAPPTASRPTSPGVLQGAEPGAGFDPEECTYDGQQLWGTVRFTSRPEQADVSVRFSTLSFDPDLRVRFVTRPGLADSCGEWYLDPGSAAVDLLVYETSMPFAADIVAIEATGFGSPGT